MVSFAGDGVAATTAAGFDDPNGLNPVPVPAAGFVSLVVALVVGDPKLNDGVEETDELVELAAIDPNGVGFFSSTGAVLLLVVAGVVVDTADTSVRVRVRVVNEMLLGTSAGLVVVDPKLNPLVVVDVTVSDFFASAETADVLLKEKPPDPTLDAGLTSSFFSGVLLLSVASEGVACFIPKLNPLPLVEATVEPPVALLLLPNENLGFSPATSVVVAGVMLPKVKPPVAGGTELVVLAGTPNEKPDLGVSLLSAFGVAPKLNLAPVAFELDLLPKENEGASLVVDVGFA